MADEYLSGNVREKLRVAHVAADQDPAFRINVEALEQVQPKDLTAGEITVRLGVTWIGSEIIKRFADELFQYAQGWRDHFALSGCILNTGCHRQFGQ